MRAMSGSGLEPIELGDRAFITEVSGVQRRVRLEQQHVRLFFRDGQVLDAVRDDREFSGAEDQIPLAQLEPVPDELALELDELHQAVVDLTDDLGTPVILKAAEHLDEIDRANRHIAARTVLVSTTVENSPLRSASATSCNSAEA